MGWKSGEQKSSYMRRRYERGICAKCIAPREPNRSRCASCLKLAAKEGLKRYADNIEKYRKISRECARRRRQDPTVKAQLNAYRLKRYHDNPDLSRKYEFKQHYGITVETYEELLKKQKGLCAI